jgi:hypothetical protein
MSGTAEKFKWRKSTRCDSASCVEVAFVNGSVGMRDSKVADGPILRLSEQSWASFVAGVRAGDFG